MFKVKDRCLFQKFLEHIDYGEQDEAEAMLKTNPILAIVQGDFIDHVGRKFKKITGFQYSIWILDWHMWNMIRVYISENEVRKQIYEFYLGSWVEKYGLKVNWNDLINSLQIYINNYDVWNYGKRNKYWCEQVGSAQINLPTHVINEYSRKDRSFYPCPNFMEQNLMRTGCCEWLSSYRRKLLGTYFAWVRGKRDEWRPVCARLNDQDTYGASYYCALIDNEALKKLYSVRCEQFYELISEVNEKKLLVPKLKLY